ncbi:MAG: hypothetical protein HDT28_05035 [Clostridiales bacterium]|nr:hypothetical protein [Clostridiales bacterium]
MKKIELLRTYDIRRLVKAGIVSPVVLRNMDMFDYYQTCIETRNPVALTACRFGVDTRTVSNAVRDMQQVV